MAIERYGSKTDVVVKLVLVFFVCLLSFSIGTYVGKKFSDNQHKIAKFEPDSVSGSVADLPEANKPKDSMTDEEFAKLAEEFVAQDNATTTAEASKQEAAGRAPAKEETAKEAAKPAVATVKDLNPQAELVKAIEANHAMKVAGAKAGAKVAAQTAPPTGKPAQPMKVAEKLAHNQKIQRPPESKVQSRIPSSLPKEIGESAIGKYTVQVGSFPNEEEAKKRTEELKAQTFSAFYVEAKVNDKTWYRVSVGLFNTKKEADAYMKDLLDRKKVDKAIVQKITKK